LRCDKQNIPSQWVSIRRAMLVAMSLMLVSCAGQPEREVQPAYRSGAPGEAATGKPASGKVVSRMPAPNTPRNWAEARLQAAHRLVLANPDMIYTSQPPDILLAIPVLTMELNGDGSIRHISVMRYPSQSRETVDMAMAAVKRAAPFGDVSRLPKPWKFNETFLFNAERKFKPMTLDQR
jgi:hypothetical protein